MFDKKSDEEKQAEQLKAEQEKAAARGARGSETVPQQAPAPQGSVPQQADAPKTTKVKVRTLTGMARNRGGQSVQGDWTEVEVTDQQLAELKADDQILIQEPGKMGAEQEEPRNVMHAAFDPALAAMHPDRLKDLAAKGGGQLPPASYQTVPAVNPNPNMQPAGSQAGLGGIGQGAQEVAAGEQAGAEMAARRGQTKAPPKP